jgi:hypothetical protein
MARQPISQELALRSNLSLPACLFEVELNILVCLDAFLCQLEEGRVVSGTQDQHLPLYWRRLPLLCLLLLL